MENRNALNRQCLTNLIVDRITFKMKLAATQANKTLHIVARLIATMAHELGTFASCRKLGNWNAFFPLDFGIFGKSRKVATGAEVVLTVSVLTMATIILGTQIRRFSILRLKSFHME